MAVTCRIDFPVYLSSGVAFGSINGAMELSFVPRIGEGISFHTPDNKLLPPAVPNYFPINRVKDVLYNPAQPSFPVLLTLEPVVVATADEARAVMQFFDAGHDFMVTVFES